jgi:hypothetical protein
MSLLHAYCTPKVTPVTPDRPLNPVSVERILLCQDAREYFLVDHLETSSSWLIKAS